MSTHRHLMLLRMCQDHGLKVEQCRDKNLLKRFGGTFSLLRQLENYSTGFQNEVIKLALSN